MSHPVAPEQQGQPPQASYYTYPPYGFAPPPTKKPRTGLIIGIVAAAVALMIVIGGAAVASFLFLRVGSESSADADVAYQFATGYPYPQHRVATLVSGLGQAELTWSVNGEQASTQTVTLPFQHTFTTEKHDFKVALTVKGVGGSASVQSCSIDVDGQTVAYGQGSSGSVQCAVHFIAES